MAKNINGRPHIPKNVQSLLWLRAGGRCEFRGCNKILYEDNVTRDPVNESNIAHIISWTETGPRGDRELSPKLATDIDNLMLTCPEHNHLIDKGENVEKYTVSVLKEMKADKTDITSRAFLWQVAGLNWIRNTKDKDEFFCPNCYWDQAFGEGTPQSNGYYYCPHCGVRLIGWVYLNPSDPKEAEAAEILKANLEAVKC